MISIDFYNDKKNLMQIICDSKELDLIRHHFSCPNPAAISRNKFIPKRLYAITPAGKFESGLLEEIKKYLISENLKFEISENIKKSKIVFNPSEIVPMHIPYREYQENAIATAIKANNGVIVVGTGGGKTLLTAGLIKNFLNELSSVSPARIYIVSNTSERLVIPRPDFKLTINVFNKVKWLALKGVVKPDPSSTPATQNYLANSNQAPKGCCMSTTSQ
jgi:hypothetical protein